MQQESRLATMDALLARMPTVGAWRRLARELDLAERRIVWTGPIDRVARRVFDEARAQNKSLDNVRAAAERVIAASVDRELAAHGLTIAVDPASVDRTAAAVRAVLKLGEAAKIALIAQASVMSTLPASAALGQIAAAREALDEARRTIEDELG